MRNAIIQRCLLLKKEISMLLLEGERQRESLNGKRHLLRIIVESQQIHLANDGLDTALQLTDALLLTRETLNHVRDNLLVDANLLKQIDLTQGLAYEILLRNNQLLLHTESIHLDVVHTVAENGIYATVIVVTEDEQTAAQIQINTREILVLETVILATIRQVDQEIVDLLTLGCI